MKQLSNTEWKSQRAYSWNIITYMQEADLLRCLRETAKNFAYILHDEDAREDGTKKEPHYHVVVTYSQQKSGAVVASIFDQYANGQNSRYQVAFDLQGCLLYLTHETEEAKTAGKYQYERKKIVLSSQSFYNRYVKDEEQAAREQADNDTFVNDLLSAEFCPIKMGRKYGRDFIKNFRSYVDYRSICLKIMLAEKHQDVTYDYVSQNYILKTTGEAISLASLSEEEVSDL